MNFFSLLKRASLGATLLILSAGSVMAQDLGAQWVDRISSELRAERTAGQGGPLTYGAQGGVLFAYDSNIFLSERNHQGEAIWIPFARAQIEYSEPQFQIAADLEADYKYYVETQGARNDDERFFGRIGYIGSIFGVSLVQLVRNESDPINVIFADRVDRIVTDTLPRLYVDITSTLSIEAEGEIQFVHFQEDIIGDSRDNQNYRVLAGPVYKTQWGLDFLLQGGAMWIHYQNDRNALGNPTAPPDVQGWLARFGIRGDLSPDLYIEAFGGVAHGASDDFKFANGTKRKGDELTTSEAWISINYKAVEGLVANLNIQRRFYFGFGSDPFQIVNGAQFSIEYQALPELVLRGNVLLNLADSAQGVRRTYSSFNMSAAYTILEHLIVDGGVTARFGKGYGDVVTNLQYSDYIFQIGIGLAW